MLSLFTCWWFASHQHLVCFHILATMNNFVTIRGKQISLWVLTFLGIYSKVKLLDQMVILFTFLRNFHPIFHSDYTILYSYQQCRKVPFIFSPWLFLEVCGILYPWPGIEPVLPAVEHGALIIGPPGNSQEGSSFFTSLPSTCNFLFCILFSF